MRACEGISWISVLVPTKPWPCRQVPPGAGVTFCDTRVYLRVSNFICVFSLIRSIICYNVINTPARVFDIDGTGF